jgi:hypothetical protein
MRAEKHSNVGTNFAVDAFVLLANKLQLVAVHLELLLLQQNNLGLIGDISTQTGQALSLSDQLGKVWAEVYEKLVSSFLAAAIITPAVVLDKERADKTFSGLVDGHGPLLTPGEFVRVERNGNLASGGVLLNSLAIGHELVLREVLEGYHGAVDEVARPGNVTRDGGQISYNRWVLVIVVVTLLNLLEDA